MKAIFFGSRVVALLLATASFGWAQYAAPQAPVYVQPPTGQTPAYPYATTPAYGSAGEGQAAAAAPTGPRRPRLHNPFREVRLINPFTGDPLSNPFRNKRLMTGQEIKESVGGFFSRVFRRPTAQAPAYPAAGYQAPLYQAPVYQTPVYAAPAGAAAPVYQNPPASAGMSTGQGAALAAEADSVTPPPAPAPTAPSKPRVTQQPPAYPAVGNPAASTSNLPKSKADEGTSNKLQPTLGGPPGASTTASQTKPAPSGDGGAAAAMANKPAGGYPVGKKTPRAGRVTSPYPPYRELDVSDLASGAMALDPITRKIFIVP